MSADLGKAGTHQQGRVCGDDGAAEMTKTPHHKWDYDSEQRIAASACADGNDRNAKGCLNCKLIKVTIIPPRGFPWHEWHTRDGKVWVGEAPPPCLVVPKVAAKILREVA